MSFEEGADRFARDSIVRALERIGTPGMKALLTLAESGVQKDLDRVVEVCRGLHSRAGFKAVAALLRNPHVGSRQRVDLILCCRHFLLDPPVNVDPVVAEVVRLKEQTREEKRAVLQLLDTPGVVHGQKSLAFLRAILIEKTTDEDLRRQAASILGRTSRGAQEVGTMLLQGKLPATMRALVLELLRKHAEHEEAVAKLLAELKKQGEK